MQLRSRAKWWKWLGPCQRQNLKSDGSIVMIRAKLLKVCLVGTYRGRVRAEKAPGAEKVLKPTCQLWSLIWEVWGSTEQEDGRGRVGLQEGGCGRVGLQGGRGRGFCFLSLHSVTFYPHNTISKRKLRESILLKVTQQMTSFGKWILLLS